jgi:hypothetical protein
MRNLTLDLFMTLDGVVQSPGGTDDDPSGGFAKSGWSFGYRDEQKERAMGESLSEPFEHAFGRKTCENDDRGAPGVRDGPRECGARP